jgi:Fic family protein
MKRGLTGQYHTINLYDEVVKAFVPNPLPPEPGLDVTALLKINEKALKALGSLDGVCRILPSLNLFLYWYVRKEALLLSQIEGTQSSLSDLLLHELDEDGPAIDDVEEVSCYIAALKYGQDQIARPDGLPMSLRLIKNMHQKLLSSGRGSHKQPGEFRTT